MRKIIRRIMILLICVALVLEDNAIVSYAAEINDVNVETNDASFEDEATSEGDVISVVENDTSEDNSDVDVMNEDEVVVDEEIEESSEEFVSEPLNGATYSLKYTVSNGEATITGYDGTASGDLIIPGTIDGYIVTMIGDKAFFYDDEFYGELKIPESVIEIGNYAFYGCKGLAGRLNIPNSVTTIGDSAFSYCNGFSGKLILPNSITTIGSHAFYKCSGFTGDLVLPNALNGIEDWVFAECSGFDGKLVIPSSVTYMSNDTFFNCSNFKDVYIPKSIVRIETFPFYVENSSNDLDALNALYHCVKGSYAESFMLWNLEWYDYLRIVEWDGKSIDGESTIEPDGPDENDLNKYGEFDWIIKDDVLYVIGEGKLPDLENEDIAPWEIYRNTITEIVLDDGISEVGKNQFKNYTFLVTVEIPTTLKKIGQNAFNGCTGLLRIDYKGTESAFKNISISVGSINKKKVALNYLADGKNVGYSHYFTEFAVGEEYYTFKDSFFDDSAFVYNHDLARLSLKTEMAAFGTIKAINKESAYDSSLNIREMMTKMGFEYKNSDIHYPAWDTNNVNTIGYAIGKKRINIGKSNECDLILVAIRGANYGSEWGSNVYVGKQGEHYGFNKAAVTVYSGLNDYLKENELNCAQTKVWIVGYSRGGAVTNLLSAKLGDENKTLNTQNIYAYDFEAPNGTINTDARSDKYGYIHNIVNPNDIVPMVAPTQWGFDRYGVDHYLPSEITHGSDLFKSDYKRMKSEYLDIVNGNEKYLENNCLPGLYLRDTLNDPHVPVAKYVPYGTEARLLLKNVTAEISRNKYVNILQGDLVEPLAIQMTGGSSIFNFHFLFDEIKKIDSLSFDLLVPNIARKYIDDFYNNIFQYHYPEMTLAWMEALEGVDISIDCKYKRYLYNCPIDIVAYNEAGDIVAECINDNFSYIEDGIIAYIDDNGQKVFEVPDDMNINFVVKATDNGELTYSAEYVNYDKLEKIESYIEMELKMDDVYTIFAEESESRVKNPQGDIEIPDYCYEGEKIDYYKLKINSLGCGEVDGKEYMYHIGEFAKVTATPFTSEDDFLGWYIDDELVSNDLEYRFPVKQDTVIEARFGEANGKMYVKGLNESYTYTGKAITPDINVYDGMNLLTKNVDYTVTFKNNININDASDLAKAPTITVKGKGNYNQLETLTFKIVASDISDDSFTADDIAVLANTKEQKPKPALKWNGKVVPATGYSYQYFVADNNGKPTGNAISSVKDEGHYVIVITGKGNYTGTRNVKLTLAGTQKLASKFTVATIPSKVFTGNAIEPELVVKDGKTLLIKDKDYSVRYLNNVAVGTASVVINGIGNYVGTKTISFKITGTPITKATAEGITSLVTYTGNDITFNNIELYIKATTKTSQVNLVENKDYTVSYVNNRKSGNATVVFTGINGYTGVLKKTFKIAQFKQADDPSRISVELDADNIAYCKGGAKPGVTVKFTNGDGTQSVLSEKIDYTLVYSKNTAVNDCSNERNLPTVKVALKGNWVGNVIKNYKITPKDISLTTIQATDKVYQNKKNAYATTLLITDTDGKKLAVSKDYEKVYEYRYVKKTNVICDGSFVVRNTNDLVNINDIIPAETSIKVTAFAKEGGNYSGSISTIYRITKSSLTSAKVTVSKQTYTGSEVYVDGTEIEIVIGKDRLEYGRDFEIVPGTFENNINKGNASVAIMGVGNYGSTKKVTYEIKAKGIQWWWKKKFSVSSGKFTLISSNEDTGISKVKNDFKVTEGELDKVQFLVWTTSGGKDDLRSEISNNFTISNDGNVSIDYEFGTYDHRNESGDYNVKVIAIGKNGDKIEVGGIVANVILNENVIPVKPTPTITPAPTSGPLPTNVVIPTLIPTPTDIPTPTAKPNPTTVPTPTQVLMPTTTPTPTEPVKHYSSSGYILTLNTDGRTATIYGYTGNASENLVIPSIIDGYTITAIGESAFSMFGDVYGTLSLPNTLITIGDCAFEYCNFTGDLIIPNSVIDIGNCAFQGCSRFTSLSLPDSIKTIRSAAFMGCSGFTGKLVIPNSLTEIGNGVFQFCSGFTGELLIPNSVEFIGTYAFWGCSGFTGTLNIPSSVSYIGTLPFKACDGFNRVINNSNCDITLPDGKTWYLKGTNEQVLSINKGEAYCTDRF